jgi:hypothetical protein
VLFTFAKLHKDEIKAVLFDLNIDFIIVLNHWLQSLSPSYSLKKKKKQKSVVIQNLSLFWISFSKCLPIFAQRMETSKKIKTETNKQANKQTNKKKLKDKDVFKLATSII